MIASGVGKRYGRALFELARADGQIDEVGRALEVVASALEASAELRAVIENPQYVPETKKRVVGALAERIGAPRIAANALLLLADRGRLRHLRAIADAYLGMAEDAAGRLRAEVISATPLPEAYYRELAKVLSDATGRTVTLVRREDPALIGGVVARVGDTVFDGSIRNRLQDMRHQMLVAAQASHEGR